MKDPKNLEVVDALVRQYLESDAAGVDGPALLDRARQTRARRRRRRRIVWVALAAACLALALTLFAMRHHSPKRPRFANDVPKQLKSGLTEVARTFDSGSRTAATSILRAVFQRGDVEPEVATPVKLPPEEGTSVVPSVAGTLAVSLTADAVQMRGNLTQFVNSSLRKAGLLI